MTHQLIAFPQQLTVEPKLDFTNPKSLTSTPSSLLQCTNRLRYIINQLLHFFNYLMTKIHLSSLPSPHLYLLPNDPLVPQTLGLEASSLGLHYSCIPSFNLLGLLFFVKNLTSNLLGLHCFASNPSTCKEFLLPRI